MALWMKFIRIQHTKVGVNRLASFLSESRRNYSSEKSKSLKGRDFLTLKDFTTDDIHQLLWTAADLKHRYKNDNENYRPLAGRSVGMIFQKRSTRTRLSTETGVALMGGHPVFLSPSDVHLGVNESLPDTAKVLSRFNDLILARVFAHSDLTTLAEYADVPIVNGLSATYHPLQILADLQALQEHYGYLRMLEVAFVGDGNNNVTHSYMMGCPLMGVNLRIACPEEFQPDTQVLSDAIGLCSQHGTELRVTTDPKEATYRADVVVTDTFVSMGSEDEAATRLKSFEGYQVDRKMVSEMKANWSFLHCLPRKQHEVTDEVFYDRDHSLVWEAAENRKWTVMSVMLHLLGNHKTKIPKPNFLYKPSS